MNFANIPSINGFGGPENAPQLQELLKALTAGYNFGVTDQLNGGSLRVESLESSLKVLTYGEENIRFWKHIPKMQAFNTVEEYNQLTAYGDTSNAFLPEGVMPETNDSNYSRKVALVKYMGTTRVVTHPMTLVRAAHGDVIALENRNGILWLLAQIERNLFWGNNTLALGYSAASGGPEGIEWSGLDQQIDVTSAAPMQIDAKGGSLTEGLLHDASELIAENFGRASHIYMPFKVASDFSKTYFTKERVVMPAPDGGLTAGTVITDYNSQFGPIKIVPDIFLTKNRKAQGLAPTSARSGNSPQTPTSIAGATGGTTGVWKATNATTQYKVTAVNRFGESASSAASANVNVSATTLVVTLTITNPNPISGLTPDYFNVYRSDDGGATFWYVKSVATNSAASAGTTTTTDDGTYMTNVSTCFIGQMAPDILAVKQLAPLMKMDLAVLGPAIRWMILFYATFVLYAPRKWCKIINVGDLS
jgi:hypothetical protein